MEERRQQDLSGVKGQGGWFESEQEVLALQQRKAGRVRWRDCGARGFEAERQRGRGTWESIFNLTSLLLFSCPFTTLSGFIVE